MQVASRCLFVGLGLDSYQVGRVCLHSYIAHVLSGSVLDGEFRIQTFPELDKRLKLMKSDIALVVGIIFILRIYSPSIQNKSINHLSEMLETINLLKKLLCI